MNKTREQLLLIINPGGSSTKTAFFKGDEQIVTENIRHSSRELKKYDSIFSQGEMRLKVIRDFLSRNHIQTKSLSAVVGRGGPIAPVPGGTYLVDSVMLNAIKNHNVMVEHASLLGAPLASVIAEEAGCPAYIVDPVSMDEMTEEARISGLPEIKRRAISHALSVKAVSRAAAKKLGRPYKELNLITVHLGSGFTIAAQKKGRQIDHNDATSSGPMAPTRAGDLPSLDFVKLCISKKLSIPEIKKNLVHKGGWQAHLGTDDIREIYNQIDSGSKKARLVLDASLLQIVKEIGGLYAVLSGKVDAMAITGGITQSERFIAELKAKLEWFREPIYIFTDSFEMRAMAEGALRILSGNEKVKMLGAHLH